MGGSELVDGAPQLLQLRIHLRSLHRLELGDRAIGHQDAGATSLAIMLEAVAASVQRELS